MRCCSLSRWLLTETYSPSAIDTAPPIAAAIPAVAMGPVAVVAPATPTTTAAVETMPSLAPSTPARSLLSFCSSPPGARSSSPPVCAAALMVRLLSFADQFRQAHQQRVEITEPREPFLRAGVTTPLRVPAR